MSNIYPTDAGEFIGDLNGGVFARQLALVLSTVAAGVVATGKGGKVQITFGLKRIGDSRQVAVTAKLDCTEPTLQGSRSEDTSSETPMYVSATGRISLTPESTQAIVAGVTGAQNV